jgi:hypothetical protein
MRTAVDFRSASKKEYQIFKKGNKDINLTYAEWLELIYGFNEEFRNYILETGEREKLPGGIGSFSITKKKRAVATYMANGKLRTNLPIDWVRTQEKGKLIYNFNHHTDGYFFGWIWFREDAKFRNSRVWKFKASRLSSRMIAHYIKEDKNAQFLYKEWNRNNRAKT